MPQTSACLAERGRGNAIPQHLLQEMQEETHPPPASPEESNQGLWSSLNWNLFD